MFKTVCLSFKGLLLINRNAFNVIRYLAKDTFRITTRVFLVKYNILKIVFFTLRTQEYFKTSMLNLRYKCLTLFVLIS
jgi:hypothetical protein